ncbi:MAG: DUF2298 domain-containing protein, partial [Dehalococcoidia bacterium]|nr:DUF2298 domain-containing protein [Dehalococcoidia bacterium]
FTAVLIFVALGLALVSDIFFIKDAYSHPWERYNTVMKSYLIQWVFMGIAASYCLYYITNKFTGITKYLTVIPAVLLVSASLVHPVASTASWTSGRTNFLGPGRHSLNGLTYLQHYNNSDYLAIKWLNNNVSGTPVILETPGHGIGIYNSRVSSLTGLPTTLGWDSWEVQWGRTWDEVQERVVDTSAIFSKNDLHETLGLISKYKIEYIYIGNLEKGTYPPEGLNKFGANPDYFKKVYNYGDVAIYKVTD